MKHKKRNKFFLVFAALFIGAAMYHLIAVFIKLNDLPLWRQTLFIFLDLIFAYGIVKRPTYFVYFVGILVLQQYYTHGYKLVDQWYNEHVIDWLSLFIVILLPVLFILLIKERIEINKKRI